MNTFRFEAVLVHRRFIEENRQKEFADARQLLIDAQEQLKMLRTKERQAALELQKYLRDKITVAENLLYTTYLDRVRVEIRNRLNEIRKIEKVVAQKRTELLEAVKKRKTLEKVKEKQASEYEKEIRRKEQIFIGEISINRYNRSEEQSAGKKS